MSHSLSGQLILPGGAVQSGTIHFSEVIEGVTPDADASAGSCFIVPGFIDTHVHGGGGGDTMDGAPGLARLCRLHAQHGTTTVLPTTMTGPWEQVMQALEAVAAMRRSGGVSGGADIAGAHLEGPFISPQRLGAQPPNTLEPTPQLVAEVLGTGVLRAVTLAPEQPGATQAGLAFARAGLRVGIGHTVADAETVTEFVRAVQQAGGRTAATHLFNAMGGVQGREPGPPGVLLADPQSFLEVILDFVHVHPTSFQLACRAGPGRTLLITDAMRAAGEGDGLSELGGQTVIVRNGEAHLENGSLAGSVLTMDRAVQNALKAGLTLPEASRMASLIPAQSIGLSDRGELRVGLRADVVVLDAEYRVLAVYVAGQQVVGQPVSGRGIS
ncbi:amidohydrolase family protein [Deinococcus sp.]|uniref:N-acetylglucosamine-6-phosphate deacetylase n=1 Tax=Deinococcus sp. TaxID=47478 RepID=UPI0025C0739E|nr:amidohydrolase family protein [Deinococcus sp.]